MVLHVVNEYWAQFYDAKEWHSNPNTIWNNEKSYDSFPVSILEQIPGMAHVRGHKCKEDSLGTRHCANHKCTYQRSDVRFAVLKKIF